MTNIYYHDIFEEQDLKNKGYRDILNELLEGFIIKNISDLEKINTAELVGSIILTYKNWDKPNGISEIKT